MHPFARTAGVSITILCAALSWGQAADACSMSQWSGGLEFGRCPNKTGVSMNRVSASKKQWVSYQLSLTQQLNVIVAQYNIEFPLIYAQWEKQQRQVAALN